MSKPDPASQRPIRCLLFLLGIAAACGGDGTGPPPTTTVAIQAGNGQTATVGQPVPVRPAVRVTQNGSGASGVSVTFAVATGGGSITGGTATTDANGVATLGSWTLGTAAGANTLTASVSGATGSPVTFTATATAGAASAISKTAGDNQLALVRAAVGTAPTVRVTDQFGNPVAGVTVTFIVTGGGGTVSGTGTVVTDANGNASVQWTLGPLPGANQLTVSIPGVPAVVFTATGQEILVQPSQDTVFQGGTLQLTRLTIAAGRTVTVAGNLTINADGPVVIDGTLIGNCVSITINGEQTLTVTGTIDNSCAAPDENAPDLELVGKGGYFLSGGNIRTSGDAEVTNDPTLTDADFPAAAPAFAPGGRAALNHVPCHVQNFGFTPNPLFAKDGTSNKHGTNGQDGRTWVLQCRGADLELSAVQVFGQDAGHGGNGNDPAGDPADASGGDGGKGGLIKVRSTGRVVFSGPVNVQSGDGGNGGDADATGLQGKAGQKAANAKAKGGKGGEPGLIEIKGTQGIVGAGNLTLTLGEGGRGGDATAKGADGEQGKSPSSREQDGGDAEAEGGAGGGSPETQLTAAGNVAGVPTLTGGNGDRGGHSTATGGNGAAGTEPKPDGGHGGAMKATGGKGGDALAKRLPPPAGDGMRVGDGGDGGQATFNAGNGADGWDDCGDPVKPGGDGGNGGSASGADGLGGVGKPGGNGDPGGVTYNTTGNGADGGDGEDPGDGGTAGGETVSENGTRTENEPSFVDGDPGNPCPIKVTGNTTITFVHTVFVTQCPQDVGTFTIMNQTNAAMIIQFVKPSLIDIIGPSTIPAGGSATYMVRFNCAMAASVAGEIKIMALQGSTVVQQVTIPVNGQVQAQFLQLNTALGPFPVGTKIPLPSISGLVNASPDVGCTTQHGHATSSSGIIITSGSNTFGPFPDPDPSGCGYGPIVLETLPPG